MTFLTRYPVLAQVLLIGALCVPLATILYLAKRDTATAVDKASRKALVTSCNRGNLVRADRILVARDKPDVEERRRVEGLFPLLDCSASQSSGGNVLLKPNERDKYLDLISRYQIPIVKNGEVIGGDRIKVAR